MSTHNVCFRGEIKNINTCLFEKKVHYLEVCGTEYMYAARVFGVVYHVYCPCLLAQ